MEQTLIIPDTHLLPTLIFKTISDALNKEHEIDSTSPSMDEITRVIFLGDYFDQYGVSENVAIYKRTADTLLVLKEQLEAEGKEVIFLIGNHDVPYLLGHTSSYGSSDKEVVKIAHDGLMELGVQSIYELKNGGVAPMVVSHAGFVRGNGYSDLSFKRIFKMTDEFQTMLERLEAEAGGIRGGDSPIPSSVWADWMELGWNQQYPRQIVGHTPQKTVTKMSDHDIWNLDTFSLTHARHGYVQLGDGSFVTYDGDIHVHHTDWDNMDDEIQMWMK